MNLRRQSHATGDCLDQTQVFFRVAGREARDTCGIKTRICGRDAGSRQDTRETGHADRGCRTRASEENSGEARAGHDADGEIDDHSTTAIRQGSHDVACEG